MIVTVYKRPNGRKEEINITRVDPEDASWFEENRIAVSMEDIGIAFALYADIGRLTEVIYITKSTDTIQLALKNLRSEAESALEWWNEDKKNSDAEI